MKISLVTQNKYKFREVKEILAKFNIEVEHINIEKPEQGATIEEIAKNAAEKLAKQLNKTIIVEDTGVFFLAFDNFPGTKPKKVFEDIGFEGILDKLKGKNRDAQFKTVAAYCEPGKEAILFTGVINGTISEEVRMKDKDVLPYEKLFIPEGYDKVWAEIPEIKQKISHRVKAFEKLCKFLRGTGKSEIFGTPS